VILYGLVTWHVAEIVDWYLTREEAEAALTGVLGDEPGWDGMVEIAAVRPTRTGRADARLGRCAELLRWHPRSQSDAASVFRRCPAS
jgi:hypothetical protein